MKINAFQAVLALLFSAILGYLIFTIAEGFHADVLYGICSGVSFLITLIPGMSFKLNDDRLTTNLRVMSTMFMILFLIISLIFAWFELRPRFYFIISGIMMLIYIGGVYRLAKVNFSKDK